MALLDDISALTTQRRQIDYRSLGYTGLNRQGGLVREEMIRDLEGKRGLEIYKEMAAYDPMCGGIVFAMDKLVRRVGWSVGEASSRSEDRRAADHVEQCMGDMDVPWIDTVSDAMSMCPMGHALQEIVLKRRMGRRFPEKAFRSKYADGKIGWRSFAPRAQETLAYWDFDACGDLVGVQQYGPPDYRRVDLPISKCLLYRTSVAKGSPLGVSIFRAGYRSWVRKNCLERIELVGAERDACGLPVIYAPGEILDETSQDPEKVGQRLAMETVGRNIRNDEQACIFIPSDRDDKGNLQYDVKLMASGGARQYNTSELIQRYNHSITASVMFDFLLMGQAASAGGSKAMHVDKTEMAIMAIEAFLDIIASTINSVAVPDLVDMNGFLVEDMPEIKHQPIQQQDLGELGTYLQSLSMAGVPLFPNIPLENYLADVAKLPRPPDPDLFAPRDEVAPPVRIEDNHPPEELHDHTSLGGVDAPALPPDTHPMPGRIPGRRTPAPRSMAPAIMPNFRRFG